MVPSSGFAREHVRLTNGEWPPYMSRELKHGGLATRIVTQAFALGGIQVEYGWLPWKRAFVYAQKGAWDGSLGWAKLPERLNDFYFSEPVFSGDMVFFHLKSHDFDWETIEDLQGIRIGATIGYSGYGQAFLRAEEEGHINVTRVASDIQNFKKLLLGRIQIFPSNKIVGYHILRKHFPHKKITLFTNHPAPILTRDYYLILSKKDPKNKELINRFNQGLKRLKVSGRYHQYLLDAMTETYDTP